MIPSPVPHPTSECPGWVLVPVAGEDSIAVARELLAAARGLDLDTGVVRTLGSGFHVPAEVAALAAYDGRPADVEPAAEPVAEPVEVEEPEVEPEPVSEPEPVEDVEAPVEEAPVEEPADAPVEEPVDAPAAKAAPRKRAARSSAES